jgi:tetratricopeptide (TPR) repeat protein
VAAREQAVAAREQAVAAYDQAEKNFQLYRDQQRESIKLGTELSDSTQYAILTKDYSKAKQMIRVLEIALDKSHEPVKRKELLLQKGTMHFVLQQFNQAARCFEEAGPGTPNTDDTWRLSQTYAKLKPNDDKRLTIRQLTELISETKTSNKAIYYLYFHHMQRKHQQSPEEYLPLTKVMLDRLNRINPSKIEATAIPLKLQKREEGYHLDLTQSPYMIYTLRGIGLNNQNMLEPLNLYSLDISHLPLLTLSELEGLQLKELNMVGLNIARKNVILKQMEKLGVERIIINADAYPRAVMKKLREKYEVIDASE